MTGLVSARSLWWRLPEVCPGADDDLHPCAHDADDGRHWDIQSFVIGTTTYLTDRYVVLRADLIEHRAHIPRVDEQSFSPQTQEGIAKWLDAAPAQDPSDRLFALRLIDPLENAGFLLRPLDDVKNVHGICSPDRKVVGVVVPERADIHLDHAYSARAAVSG